MISIYIPRIDANLSLEEIKNTFENVFNLGTILRIECESNRRSSYHFYCYIFFLKWNNNEYANYILPRIQMNEVTCLTHPTFSNYWLIYNNLSEISFYRDPIHMDLILYLHSDIRSDTILSTIESLHIGKVDSIEMKNDDQSPFKTNIIIIHFEYWYRTKASYSFQKHITNNHYNEINISHTINQVNPKIVNRHFWTFYPESPKLIGMNPNIWNRDNETDETLVEKPEKAEEQTEDPIDTSNESTEQNEFTTDTNTDVLDDIICDPLYVLPNRWNN